MPDVSIRVRDNGPLVIEGPVRLVDVDGREFSIATDKPGMALCRCGLSSNKPFCDGSHKPNFQSVCRAPNAS